MNKKCKSMRLPVRRWLLPGLAGALVSASLAAQAYELTDLGVDVVPKDISDLGVVVGTVNGPLGTGSAFRWMAGSLEQLNPGTVANGINIQGQITGDTPTGAFLFDESLAAPFVDLGDGYTGGAINNLGRVAGSQAGINPLRPSPVPINPAVYDGQWQSPDIASVYSRGRRQGVYAAQFRLVAYNDSGYAVGHRIKAGIVGSASIMVTPTLDVVSLPVPYGGRATAINSQGMIVGTTGSNSRTNEYEQAYLYDGAAARRLGTLGGGLTSSAADINETNQVVGTSRLVTQVNGQLGPETDHAFLWENDVMKDLNDLIAPGSGWILTSATAINNEGGIVGTGLYDGDGDGQREPHGFMLTATVGDPL